MAKTEMKLVLMVVLLAGSGWGQSIPLCVENGNKAPCILRSESDREPLDVPAVQEPSTEPPNGPSCLISPCGHGMTQWCHGNGSMWQCSDKPPLVWTCADKTRILEHDQQEPPKYWCRKVQR